MTTIKRQYSLPNFTLVLEGLSEATENNPTGRQSPMSILVNAECRFVGSNQLLSGGRVFLESLVKAVSAYAQEFLSGLPHTQNIQEAEAESISITIHKVEENHLHRIILEPESETDKERIEIELNTIQLFDLVEAIDQFFADGNTLPDLTLKLEPLSKRYRPPEEPLADRVIPATLGVASLAAAAALFSLLPPPEVREPEPRLETNPLEETLPNTSETEPPGASPNPSDTPAEDNASTPSE